MPDHFTLNTCKKNFEKIKFTRTPLKDIRAIVQKKFLGKLLLDEAKILKSSVSGDIQFQENGESSALQKKEGERTGEKEAVEYR